MDEQAQAHSTYHVIKAINDWPQDLGDPLFATYPAMKLGQKAAVDFYADQLTATVEQIMARSPALSDWVLMVPPVYHLPAGASLMARAMADHIAGVEVVEPQLTRAIAGNGYAMAGLSVRADNRRRQDEALDRPLLTRQMGGRPVIVINDINVTGTQEAFLAQLLVDVGAVARHWNYVFTVDRDLGARYPQLEHELNVSCLQSLDDFRDLLAMADTVPTARCMERLFDLPTADFSALTSGLTAARCAELRSLAIGEGRYDCNMVADKLEILKNREADHV